MKFKWGQKLKYRGTECLFISYATGCKSAFILLLGDTEAIKVPINELPKTTTNIRKKQKENVNGDLG